MKRPISITIISWILIVLAVIASVAFTVHLNNPAMIELAKKNPIPFPIQIAIGYLGFLITLVCGIGFLLAQNWARFLYVIWGVLNFVVALITSSAKLILIPDIIIFLAILFFLFRPIANRYFKQPKTA